MQHLYGAGLFYNVLYTVYLFNLVVSCIVIDDLIEFIEAVIVHRHSWESQVLMTMGDPLNDEEADRNWAMVHDGPVEGPPDRSCSYIHVHESMTLSKFCLGLFRPRAFFASLSHSGNPDLTFSAISLFQACANCRQ